MHHLKVTAQHKSLLLRGEQMPGINIFVEATTHTDCVAPVSPELRRPVSAGT